MPRKTTKYDKTNIRKLPGVRGHPVRHGRADEGPAGPQPRCEVTVQCPVRHHHRAEEHQHRRRDDLEQDMRLAGNELHYQGERAQEDQRHGYQEQNRRRQERLVQFDVLPKVGVRARSLWARSEEEAYPKELRRRRADADPRVSQPVESRGILAQALRPDFSPDSWYDGG